tara:strand:- start:236 stop:514 length:279 start_codon:yes stop_codon:yes gene_type:complete
MGAIIMIYEKQFPFDEIKRNDGEYFDTAKEAMTATGLGSSHVWVIIESDTGNDNEYCYTTSPPHHYINKIGYIATQEPHDHETYYNETVSFA